MKTDPEYSLAKNLTPKILSSSNPNHQKNPTLIHTPNNMLKKASFKQPHSNPESDPSLLVKPCGNNHAKKSIRLSMFPFYEPRARSEASEKKIFPCFDNIMLLVALTLIIKIASFLHYVGTVHLYIKHVITIYIRRFIDL